MVGQEGMGDKSVLRDMGQDDTDASVWGPCSSVKGKHPWVGSAVLLVQATPASPSHTRSRGPAAPKGALPLTPSSHAHQIAD